MKGYHFDIIAETLTISRDFEQELVNRESDEYKLYHQLREDHPNLRLVRRTHATPKVYHASTGDVCKGNPNRGLTYNAMERFINALPEHDVYMKEFQKSKELAAALGKRPYTLARQWFQTQFPDYRRDPLKYLKEQPKLMLVSELTNEKAA